MSSILTLGAVAVGGYFLYEWLTTPAAAATTATTPVTTTATTPVTTTAATPVSTPVVATSGGTTVSTGTTPVSTTVTTGGAPLAALPSLASVYQSLMSGAATDPNFTGSGSNLSGTPYQWAFYLNLALAPSGHSSPDLTNIFPGVNDANQMTLATFWAGMSPALGADYGMSGFSGQGVDGLGCAGLGCFGLGQDDSTDTSGGVISFPTIAGGGTIAIGPTVCPGDPLCPVSAATGAAVGSSTAMWLGIGAVGLIALMAIGR